MLAAVAARYIPSASAGRGLIPGRYSSSIADRSVRPPTATTYSEEQQRIGRPISPHVTVYKQTLPAIASITNRVSGVVLSLGLATGSVVAATGGDVPTLIWSAIHSTPGPTPLAKFLVAYPLTYHWMNAARHQFWDWKPETITLPFARRTSKAIFGAALVLSGAASMVTLDGPVQTPDV